MHKLIIYLRRHNKMKNVTSIIQPLIGYLFLSLIIFGMAPSVLAVCVNSYDSSGELQQDVTVVAVDANNGCTDITGQVGCSIKNPVAGSTCTFNEGGVMFTATVIAIDSLGMRWNITGNNTAIDSVIYGGGAGGKNNCAAFHTFDVTSGSGGDCKVTNPDGSCATFQNFTSIDFCTDNVTETPPPPPVVADKLGFCQDPGSTMLGVLDQTGIQCPVYTESDPPPPDSGLMIGDQKPVVVCNLEKDKTDWGATDGSDLCCQCGIPLADQQACVVTEDRDQCDQEVTINPTQSVQLIFSKDDLDPVTWIYTSQGWKLISY